jgi:hypothetical protein
MKNILLLVCSLNKMFYLDSCTNSNYFLPYLESTSIGDDDVSVTISNDSKNERRHKLRKVHFSSSTESLSIEETDSLRVNHKDRDTSSPTSDAQYKRRRQRLIERQQLAEQKKLEDDIQDVVDRPSICIVIMASIVAIVIIIVYLCLVRSTKQQLPDVVPITAIGAPKVQSPIVVVVATPAPTTTANPKGPNLCPHTKLPAAIVPIHYDLHIHPIITEKVLNAYVDIHLHMAAETSVCCLYLY